MVLELFMLAFAVIFIFGAAFAVKIKSMDRRIYRFYNKTGMTQVAMYEKFKTLFENGKLSPGSQNTAVPADSGHTERESASLPQEQEADFEEPRIQENSPQEQEGDLLGKPDEIDFMNRRKMMEF